MRYLLATIIKWKRGKSTQKNTRNDEFFIVICRHMAMSGVSPQLFPILTSTLPPSMKVLASSKLFSYMVSNNFARTKLLTGNNKMSF
jgi:hypothetical protein